MITSHIPTSAAAKRRVSGVTVWLVAPLASAPRAA
ncbi:MAG: hypothetical protein ACI8UR_000200 [Natronomonas sp.]|jgi:hypothetical protein